MRKVKKVLSLGYMLIVLMATHLNASSLPAITYSVSYHVSETIPYLRIEMSLKGESTGQTFIKLPSKWANQDYRPQFKNLKMMKYGAEIKDTSRENPYIKVIHHKPGQNLQLSYELHQHDQNPMVVEALIIRDDLIHAPGYGLWVTPVALDKKDSLYTGETYNITIAWHNFPKDWSTISSYGRGTKQVFTSNQGEFLHALYIAGKVRLHTETIHNNPLYISMYGDFPLSDKQLIQAIETVVKVQRDFFGDYDFPHYLISLIEGTKIGYSGGTRVENSFTGYAHKHESPEILLYFLSHEHFHNWTGGKIRIGSGPKNYWWSEGFTEYYAIQFLRRSGLDSHEQSLFRVNDVLRHYYTSPVRLAHNKRIIDDFWNDMDVEKLPYYRGFVFAYYVDNLIRKASNCKSTVDDLMKAIFHRVQKTGEQFSQKMFLEVLGDFIPQDFSDEFNKFIIEGNLIPQDVFANSFATKTVVVGEFYLGFDLNALVKNQLIKNLDPKSAAYQAGLREGDIIIDRTPILLPEPLQEVMMTTQKGNTVRFQPQKNPQSVVQLISCEPKKKLN